MERCRLRSKYIIYVHFRYWFSSLDIYLPCTDYDDCSSCSDVPGCGWCEDDAKCSNGNIEGPLSGGGCKAWHYQECPGGLQVINYIILALLIIFILINVITFCLNSTAAVQPEVRLEWYRFQRSSKTWVFTYFSVFFSY